MNPKAPPAFSPSPTMARPIKPVQMEVVLVGAAQRYCNKFEIGARCMHVSLLLRLMNLAMMLASGEPVVPTVLEDPHTTQQV